MDDSAVCHADDAPRMMGHLPLISAGELLALVGTEAVEGIPCQCGLLPVMTPLGLRGMELEEWQTYRLLCAAAEQMAIGSEVGG